ncbi:MAG: response regulator transcription factor, partial [Myxococcales bacterium]|nr:response regulator transcription factor [Myxococcales bacterium]
MAERILLIEDDPELGRSVVERLAGAGYDPIWWQRGERLSAGEVPEVALVILDLMLPGVHGLDVLRDLRAHSEVPVMVLSARNDTHDKVRALRLGADDYMTKPFWPEELLERVRARLRRPSLQRDDAVVFGP